MVYRHHLFFAITIDRSCLTIAIIFDNKARSWLEVFRTLPNLISEFPSTLLPLGRRHEFPRNWVWQFVVVRIEIFVAKVWMHFSWRKPPYVLSPTYILVAFSKHDFKAERWLGGLRHLLYSVSAFKVQH